MIIFDISFFRLYHSHCSVHSTIIMLNILVWLLMVSSLGMSKTITVIGDCKCQNRRYSAVWANIRRQPSSQGSAGRPISCVTKSDDDNMAVVSRIEGQFLISSYLNEFKLDQRINEKKCFMAYSWDSAYWTRCSSASEQCILELATVPIATLMVKLVCPSKAQLRRMKVCPILIGHSVQDTRSNEDRVILMTIPDVLGDSSHLDDMTSIEEGDTECDLRAKTIPEDARSFIASEVIGGKYIPYSAMR